MAKHLQTPRPREVTSFRISPATLTEMQAIAAETGATVGELFRCGAYVLINKVLKGIPENERPEAMAHLFGYASIWEMELEEKILCIPEKEIEKRKQQRIDEMNHVFAGNY